MDQSTIIIGLINMLMPFLLSTIKSTKSIASLKKSLPALLAAIAVLQNVADLIQGKAGAGKSVNALRWVKK